MYSADWGGAADVNEYAARDQDSTAKIVSACTMNGISTGSNASSTRLCPAANLTL